MAPTEESARTAWDLYGRSSYALAYALLGDEGDAVRAVSSGMREACSRDATVGRSEVVRSVYASCREKLTDPTSARACLALCVYGRQTYRETAALLDLPAQTVADLLVSGLRDLAGSTPRGE